METSLHQQLKSIYAADPTQTEVTIQGFRVDAIGTSGELIEIQHASLGALRDKVRKLLASRNRYELRIVKPIIRRKRITTVNNDGTDIVRSRMSPKTCDWLDLFNDLVHFVRVFPKKRLTLEVLLIEAEEIRVDCVPRHRRAKSYRTVDMRISELVSSFSLVSSRDLLNRLPVDRLPPIFDTGKLALALGRPRWLAQKVAYCLREMKAIRVVGKQGNSQLYRIASRSRRFSQTDAA